MTRPAYPQYSKTPTLIAEIAFASNPGDASYTWQDVSRDLLAGTITRGRNDELSTIAAGTGTFRLDNSSRQYEPQYAGSPYYPNVDVLRPIRLRATWAGTTYPLFQGYIERIPPTRRSVKGAEVTLECVDAFELFAQTPIDGLALAGGLTGTAIAALANTIGWPAGLRALDAGQSTLIASTGSGDALNYLQALADSELGYVFMDAAGNLVFHDRFHRIKLTSSSYTFDPAGTIPYSNAVPTFDKAEIANDWTINDQASHSANAQDAASIARYFHRSKSRSVLLSNVNELRDQANFLLSRYKDSARRFRDLQLKGGPKTFAALLDLDLGDRVSVVERPIGGGTLTQAGYVEQISLAFAAGVKWEASYRLSPASQEAYWVAGVSQAGIDTRPVY